MCKVIAIANQKGGVGNTVRERAEITACENAESVTPQRLEL